LLIFNNKSNETTRISLILVRIYILIAYFSVVLEEGEFGSLKAQSFFVLYSLLLREMTNWRTYFSWWRVILQEFFQVLNQEFFDIFALWLVWFLVWRRMLWWSLACLFLFQYLVMFSFLLVCLLLDFAHFCLLLYYIESVSCAHDL
jgi:hypothetical protein